MPPPVASVCASRTSTDGVAPLIAVRGACPANTDPHAALVGVNIFDALWCGSAAMASPCNYEHDVLHALRSLKKSGLRVFRFFASLYGWRQVQWLRDPPRFWATFDRLMDEVQALGLVAIVSIGAESWHEVANRWANASESLNDLVLNASSISRGLAVRYVSEVVRRYRARSCVLFWELGNELNLASNMPARRCTLAGNLLARPSRCFGTAALVDYTRVLVAAIRLADERRPVSSGFGVARFNAWQLERDPLKAHGAVDTVREWQRMIQWEHEAVDIVSTHLYAGTHGCWFGRQLDHACHRQSNISVLTAAADAAAEVGKPLYIGEYGGPAPNFTGPTLNATRFPEAVLRWQIARTVSPHQKQHKHRQPQPTTISSIWSWTCAAKRATMHCIWPGQYIVEAEGSSESANHRMQRLLVAAAQSVGR